MKEVKCIGHLINNKGLKMELEKVHAVLEMPKPTDVSGVGRFVLQLHKYNIQLVYKLEKEMYLALSRAYLKDKQTESDSVDKEAINIIKDLTVSEERLKEIQQHTVTDTQLQKLKHIIQSEWQDIKSDVSHEINIYFDIRDVTNIQRRMDTFLTAIYMALICLVFTADDKTETTRVNTPSGPINGFKTQNKNTGMNLHEFRGIPFGKPPVGPLRFKKPEPVDKWTDVLDATEYGAGCPQTVYIPDLAPRKISEDCLFLNVYVPGSLDESRKLSVMVWIYGGGLMAGFSSQYDGGWIATQGNVIVITISYRVDILGFFTLDHPAALGNYGLWDQKLALQWVHDNIASFGGNPDSVTLFGESAGGLSASFQSLIPSNQGLVHRIIAQSGVVNRMSIMTKKLINDRTIELAQKTSCPINDMFKFVNCLRDKDYSELLEATNIGSFMAQDRIESYQLPYFAVVDGELFHDHPITSLDDKSTEVA
ncbi:Hypothetical predicted protein [Mytilus galloprovincialis]|uniref:Carboxylic ester hydrolase n=1 Tax=Mytilus galloprovincialis TaxID=29158 RepID=A0A8B6H113_MYTGA|nr:Hypothetical predicted protein [Mytilus galloprovincialis]